MKSSFATTFVLIGATAAIPAPTTADDPVRQLPSFWEFNLTDFEGPGCDDIGRDIDGFNTRLTYGMNTVDGSEIYYQHVAYPHLNAAVGPDEDSAHTWCETTLQYTELESHETKKPKAEYRLKLHKNGTRMIAMYDLEEGVQATWKFTYYPEGRDEVVDTITVNGPHAPDPNNSGDTDNSPVDKNDARWALPKCGTGTIKYRTDLYVKATKKGAKGQVYSMKTTEYDKPAFYGAQQAFSYDFEKCTK